MDRSLTVLHERAFDAVTKRCGNTLLFNGRKANVVASPIENELVQEIVGYLPKRASIVEIKRSDFRKFGLTNENYVALDGIVLRVRKLPDDAADFAVHIVLHSTPDQDGATAGQEESGFVNLEIGQVVVPVQFLARKSSPNYVFAVLEIENVIDANPMFIGIVPVARTIDTFTLNLDAAPDTVNYVLRWKVVL
jgi:hypothetical protein